MKHSNEELNECIVETMDESIENLERTILRMKEIKRVSNMLTWENEFNLYGKLKIRKGIGVYFIYHKEELVYIGTGVVADRIAKFRDAVKGKNIDHNAGKKAFNEDPDISNYSATYVILGSNSDYDRIAADLEYNLIKINKIRGLAKYNTEKMAGK
jgi:hypothetical protein